MYRVRFFAMLCGTAAALQMGLHSFNAAEGKCACPGGPPNKNCGAVVLQSNADVNRFLKMDGGKPCTTLGSLTIQSFSLSAAALAKMTPLKAVCGTVTIQQITTGTLEGLNNLEYIGGSFTMQQNSFPWSSKALTDVTALNKLAFVGGALFVKQNDGLNKNKLNAAFANTLVEGAKSMQNGAKPGTNIVPNDYVCPGATSAPTPSPTTPPTEAPTPAPSDVFATPSPTPCAGDGCSIFEDPHIIVFDGQQISLLRSPSLDDQYVDLVRQNLLGQEMWLVRNRLVNIQARFLPEEDVPTENLFMKEFAVGGQFLKGNKLIVGPLNGKVTWNGQDILAEQTSNFKAGELIDAKRHVDSSLVEDMSKRAPGIDIHLPLGVKLTVNRQPNHVNVHMAMPPLAGGQDGLCGNYNGNPEDDALELILKNRDPTVDPSDSLFHS